MKADTLLFEFIHELFVDHCGNLDEYLNSLDAQKALMEKLNAKYSKSLGAECFPTKYVNAKIDIIKSLYKL